MVERAIDDALGDGLLAVSHEVVHELGDDLIAILGVGKIRAFLRA
jgi:hypothetical protein